MPPRRHAATLFGHLFAQLLLLVGSPSPLLLLGSLLQLVSPPLLGHSSCLVRRSTWFLRSTLSRR
jgi:hypothetical protein